MTWGVAEEERKGAHQTAEGVEQPDRVALGGDPDAVVDVGLCRVVSTPARRQTGAGEAGILLARGGGDACPVGPADRLAMSLG